MTNKPPKNNCSLILVLWIPLLMIWMNEIMFLWQGFFSIILRCLVLIIFSSFHFQPGFLWRWDSTVCVCLLIDQPHRGNHELTGNFKHIWQGATDFRAFMFLLKKKITQQKKNDIWMHPWALLLLDIRPCRSSSLGFQVFIVSATHWICCLFTASSFSYSFMLRIPVWLTNQYLTG